MSPNPTPRLLAGLLVILIAIALFSAYSLRQIDGLRLLQLETVDRNRRDSLQLLRIQNNLQNLALSMRDMIEGESPYPLTAWRSEFDRTRADLEDALRLEQELAPTTRTVEQQSFPRDSLGEFWNIAGRMFSAAESGDAAESRRLIREVLLPRHASISSTVARFLVSNNEAEQQAAETIAGIYASVERNTYYFVIAVFAAIFVTGAYMVIQNRRTFRDMADLSQQRQVLARRLIGVQEDLFQSIARELHDEFGQTLTAAGAMLTRLEKRGAGSPEEFQRGVAEIKEVTQDALNGVRRLSQRLHPNILDDYGLQGAIEWYTRQIGEQSGLDAKFESSGGAVPAVPQETAIHVYRIAQESLGNVVRHSGSPSARVRLGFEQGILKLEIEDRGTGMPSAPERPRGLGLVAMRERAELIGGRLSFSEPTGGGVLVRLEVSIMNSSERS
jgi:signal transduction histidine kinase